MFRELLDFFLEALVPGIILAIVLIGLVLLVVWCLL